MAKMNFEEFVKEVTEKIGSYLPEYYKDCNIEVKTVTKNNDVTLTGLIISIPGVRITPNIYLEHFYQEYEESGIELDEVIEKIVQCRIKNEVPEHFQIESFLDFKKCRDKIFPKVINKEYNHDYLSDKVFMPLSSNLAIVYQVVIDSSETGTASITVTNEILKNWHIHLTELDKIAIENMKRETPSEFMGISQIIREIAGDKFADSIGFEAMYVLTNKRRVNGAAAVLDEDIMKMICEKFENDDSEGWYILPSSVHELLIVPALGMDPEQLRQMVVSVNGSEVSPEDRLSDDIYIYDKEKKDLIVY